MSDDQEKKAEMFESMLQFIESNGYASSTNPGTEAYAIADIVSEAVILWDEKKESRFYVYSTIGEKYHDPTCENCSVLNAHDTHINHAVTSDKADDMDIEPCSYCFGSE